MQVVLLALGSRGDVQPFAALGLGLQARGYDVRLGVSRDLAAWVRAQGLAAEEFDVDIGLLSREGPGLAWEADGSRGFVHEVRLLADLARETAPAVAEGVLRITAGADLVVSGALTYDAASVVCDERGVRLVLGLMAPTSPARSGESTVFVALPDRTSVLNQVAAAVGATAAYRMFRPSGLLVREELGRPRSTLAAYVRRAVRTPALLAVSTAVVPRAPEWGTQIRPTGYWVMPDAEDYQPPEALRRFLADGPAPVYLGFGSMVSRDPAALTTVLLDAVRQTGRRAVLSAGWTGLAGDAAELPDGVLTLGEVPHDWLLPRCAAVVHHGGAGTTAAAVRSGRPQVVVPHVGDQFYWGRRVRQLGIGPEAIRRHLLDADVLARAVEAAVATPRMAARAAELGERVRAEDGVAVAVGLLDALVGRTGGAARA